VNLVIWT